MILGGGNDHEMQTIKPMPAKEAARHLLRDLYPEREVRGRLPKFTRQMRVRERRE